MVFFCEGEGEGGEKEEEGEQEREDGSPHGRKMFCGVQEEYDMWKGEQKEELKKAGGVHAICKDAVCFA